MVVVVVEVTDVLTGFWAATTVDLLAEEVMVTDATVDFLALSLTTAGLALVVIVTVLLEVAFFLFFLGFGATVFPRNFPLPPFLQSRGFAKVLKRYLRLKMPHSFWRASATTLA